MTSTNSTEPAGVRRLREARAAKAARQQAASAQLSVRPGDMIHTVTGGFTVATGGGYAASAHVARPNESICLTAAIIAASFSASGWSWLSIIDDDAAQLARWGEVRFRTGQAPTVAPVAFPVGSPEWLEARQTAVTEAWAHPTAEARASALADVAERFGPPASTAVYSVLEDPSVKAAAAQQKALDEGGVRFRQHVEAREAGVVGERR